MLEEIHDLAPSSPLAFATGDDDVVATVVHSGACGELTHASGADDEHGLPGESAGELRRGPGGGLGKRDDVPRDGGLGARPLADAQRALEQRGQRVPRRALVGGRAKRLAHLSENLRLADDHRVGSRRDVEQVVDGRGVVVGVQPVRDAVLRYTRNI